MEKPYNPTVPSWLVYIDESGKYQAVKEWGGEFTRDELEFMGYEILGNPCFNQKSFAIDWVISCQR
jgi:hypothetical protein